jgi:hypothetical protein
LRLASPFDLEQINKWVERDSGREVDFSEFLSCTLNACLIEGEGGALFVWRAPGIFELHLFFEQRGREAIELLRRMLDTMRREFGAQWFWAAIPWDQGKQSRKVRLFARRMGWKLKGRAMFPHGLCEVFTSEIV